MFPELSLTGYTPERAKDLALSIDDSRLAELEQASRLLNIRIVAGAPIRTQSSPRIGALCLSPSQPMQVFYKQHLHKDEFPFFTEGPTAPNVLAGGRLALAICYEATVPTHMARAKSEGAALYLASVAKTADGMMRARASLSVRAKDHKMPVLVVNCVGESEGKPAGGQSFVMGPDGIVRNELSADQEGMLFFDT